LSNRAQRRRTEVARQASMQRYRREAGSCLWTFVVGVDEDLSEAPLLQRTVLWWLDALPTFTPLRQCICCSDDLWHRDQVAGFLLSTPSPLLHVPPVSASGICRGCWHGRDLAAVESAVSKVLSTVVVGGRLEPFPVRW
jgi:hypothetical protein